MAVCPTALLVAAAVGFAPAPRHHRQSWVHRPHRVHRIRAHRVHRAAAPTRPAARVEAPPPNPAELTVAIMPAQFFSADEGSAQQLTEAVRQDFSMKGWKVLPADALTGAWTEMGLKASVHYRTRPRSNSARR